MLVSYLLYQVNLLAIETKQKKTNKQKKKQTKRGGLTLGLGEFAQSVHNC